MINLNIHKINLGTVSTLLWFSIQILKKVIEQLKIIVTMNNILSTNHTSIYKLLFVLFFAGICNLPFKCNAQEYSKLDEVPQWVKEKVNHEEYKLWEVMSSVFQIDYSFLKKRYLSRKKKRNTSPLAKHCVKNPKWFIQYRKRLFILCSWWI